MKRLALIAAATLALTLTSCSTTPPPVSDKVAAAYAEGSKLSTPTAAATPPTVPLTFAAGTHAVFFGDSWTSGLFMQPVTNGYAYLSSSKLGLDVEVIGGNGTGYLNAGSANLGAYGDRMNVLPVSDAKLLVIQGSVNDLGRSLSKLGPAFDAVLATARGKFPQAQIVIIGPSTAQWPVQSGLYSIDDILSERSANAGVHYVSPYRGQWINEANFATMIDPKTGHPSQVGHAYLASKVEESLNALKAK